MREMVREESGQVGSVLIMVRVFDFMLKATGNNGRMRVTQPDTYFQTVVQAVDGEKREGGRVGELLVACKRW